VFAQAGNDQTLLEVMRVGWSIALAASLSRAPRWAQAALMMLEGFEPEGVVRLAIDSMRILPQLGIMVTVNPQAALEFFERGCLIRLGTAICPVGRGRDGEPCVSIELTAGGDAPVSGDVRFGEIRRFPLQPGQSADAVIKPARGFDLGNGPGVRVDARVDCGLLGVIVDCRGRRPMRLPADGETRRAKLVEWMTALDAYPVAELRRLSGLADGR
jgi:hypothetical protein